MEQVLQLRDGDWMVCLGVWMYVPWTADHTDIAMARRMLHRIELDRMEDPIRYDRLTATSPPAEPAPTDTAQACPSPAAQADPPSASNHTDPARYA